LHSKESNCSSKILNLPGKLRQEGTQKDAIAESQTARKSIVNAFRLALPVHLNVIAASAKMMNNPGKDQRLQVFSLKLRSKTTTL
jgi:hypothetical protein